jgi:acetylornithine/succinyldiaminopimelate/putrescine aminotransferase/predicted amino acid dehydrogenase
MFSMSVPSIAATRGEAAPDSSPLEGDKDLQRLRDAPRENRAPTGVRVNDPGMRFAFLIHPISAQMKNLMDLDRGGRLRSTWGHSDLLRFCAKAHGAVADWTRGRQEGQPKRPQVVDTFDGLVSSTGARAEGRLYEIPLDARSILEDPDQALSHMEQAVSDAIDWGARIVGLGSMTGIIGNHGAFLAETHPIAVTTGNSLTVYATLRNLELYCESLGIDLADEDVAIIGIPGSIATAVASILAPRCRPLVLVARRMSPRVIEAAERLNARLEVDLPKALAEASIVVTATSSGNCVEPSWLRPGCLVLDVGVPSDVHQATPARDDVLILAAGYARVPAAMPRDSCLLRFYHGIVPSCLGETMVLALENRAESFSIGRELDLDRVREIGRLAETHGFAFSEALASGVALSPGARSQFLKVLARTRSLRSHGPRGCTCRESDGVADTLADVDSIALDRLAEHAAERHARHISPVLIGIGGPTGLTPTFVRGKGVELFDESGRAYLDFVAGFGSLNLGHNHAEVVAAVASALSQHAPGFSPASVNPLAAALAEELVAITPGGLEIVFFTNSGAESIEAALKLARAATGRSGFLSCRGSFHGKTFGALSVTGNQGYQRPFGPLVPDCQAIPFGDLHALELALATHQYGAFLVEPIQGEGGMVTPPPGYLAEAHRLCHQAGTLFIADEVQTGLGRTGPMFAVERDGVAPDILTLAKSLGGGLIPLGAMIARRDHWLKAYGSYQTFALHSSTFSGGSLACAAGLATLRILRDRSILVQAAHRANELREGLESIARTCSIIRAVRGHGLMLGLEFHELSPLLFANFKGFSQSGANWWLVPGHEDLLSAIPALYVQSNLLHEHGIYTQPTRSNPRVLRIQPPLIVSAAQVERFLESLRSTCAEWALLSECADTILSKSAGEMRPG